MSTDAEKDNRRDLTRWGRDLVEMTEAWQGAVTTRERARASKELRTVSEWQCEIADLERRRTELQRSGLWYHGRPDMLGILGCGRRELYHSQMLAWLLDPGTPNGLGDRFLRGFLALLDGGARATNDTDLFEAQIITERVGNEARTDIVIRGSRFTVAIEVKVDAGEGTEQCNRTYADYVEFPDPSFVFLTPGGGRPETATGEAEEAFQAISFAQVTTLLSELVADMFSARRPISAADRVADLWESGLATCLTYLSTLRREFL